MNYLALLKFLPLIISTVKAVEAELPDSPGKAKFDAAVAMITTVEESLANALPALTPVINGVVAMFKSGGVFKPSAAPSTAPAAT